MDPSAINCENEAQFEPDRMPGKLPEIEQPQTRKPPRASTTDLSCWSSPALIGRKTHSAHFSLHFEWCWVAPSWCSAESSVFTSPLSLSLSHFTPSLISNLQHVLIARNDDVQPPSKENESYELNGMLSSADVDDQESPGLTLLVDDLLRDHLFNVHICAPQSDKSVSGHSLTVKETLAATSIELSGATAYAVSGTPADCVSLALSGALFSWSKPILVIICSTPGLLLELERH
ncbi:hypothetical protein LWI28_005466 [Acer negundo]|uniref:Survival protein SurE-like phosphatase/nucleotidase domain-containing protein n=1 Tax=Acer negundo TaxID=4023 RepID=A0AAD5J324_ACENE|nr:hypothetical protein LWI28_005466 [Acer negundo]